MEDRLRGVLSDQGRNEGSSFDEQLSASCRQFFAQRVEFHRARQPDSYLEKLKARYTPLNSIMEQEGEGEMMDTSDGSSQVAVSSQEQGEHTDGIPRPKRVLFGPKQLEMKWKQTQCIGAGLTNMGNSCFLNSVLQCMTYTPPLYNYLMSNHHKQKCAFTSTPLLSLLLA